MRERQQIAELVKAVNDAFLNADANAIRTVLNEIFHKDMVIRGPEFKLVAEGKKACIDSYVDVASAATIRSFEGSEPIIDLFDDMATAKYSWQLSYYDGWYSVRSKGR